MNELLSLAIKAHGGLDRWSTVTSVQAATSITGAIWYLKGKPDVLKNVIAIAETRTERVAMTFPGQDKQSTFEPDRVVIEKNDGTLIEARDNPEASFDGQRLNTPWDDVHVAYFSGEALDIPEHAVHLRPRRLQHRGNLINRGGWGDLAAPEGPFPDTVKSHTREQISCFGPDGLLRRHDYTVDILQGGTGLNYASDYETSMASSCRPNDGSMPTKATASWSKSLSSSRSTSPASNWPGSL
jgi:hypothetical protein